MGLNRTWIALTGGLIICAGAEAQDFVPDFYFRGDIGPALTEDTDIESFVGALGPATVEFETGVRMGVAGGYRFCPWFSLEGELGWIYNEVDRVSGGISADARLMQAPFMGNAVLQFRNPTGITPFGGGGAGVCISILDIDEAQSGFTFVEGSAADSVFAWQLFGGLRYDFTDKLGIGLVYKYFNAEGAEWDVENTSQDIGLEETTTHSVSLVVNLQF